MSYNIFGTGTQPTLFKGKIQNNCENCNNAGDSILTCEDVLLCVNLNLFGNLTSPYIPYWDGTQFQDTTLSRVVDAGPINIALDRGTSFRSHISGEAQFGFDASGDGFYASTDAGAYLESFIEMLPTQMGMYIDGGSSKVELFSTALYLYHTGDIVLQALNIDFNGWMRIADTFSLDTIGVGDTAGLFNANASVVTFGKSGGTINIVSTLFMQGSKLQLAASTVSLSPINFASGVAPSAPTDGDVWFDGTDLKMRIGGVTKTFTIV